MTYRTLLASFLLTTLACGDPDPPQTAPSIESTEARTMQRDTVAEAYAAALPQMPRPAPDFELPTLENDTLRLADLRGGLALINFWATWCAPCIAEIPELAALHEDIDGLTVVGVSLDAEGFAAVRPFAAKYSIPYPVVVDDGTLADAYGGVYGLPVTFLVDQEGQIVNRFTGLFPVDEMREPLREMLGLPVVN